MPAAIRFPSPVLATHDRRAALAKSDPLLAFAYWIEAAGVRRIEGDVIAPAVLTDMRERARRAIERLDHFKQVDQHLQGTALH